MRLAFAILLLMVWSVAAEDIYVSQFGTGTKSGADTNNCQTLQWFNTASSWGAGVNKISPDDTVWLFGLFTTNGADATLLVVPTGGSGTAGHPVRIKAVNTGTILEAQQFAHFAGGLSFPDNGTLDPKHDFIIDSLIIRNTSNGSTNSGLLFHSPSEGMNIIGSNIEVTNCTITNIFAQSGLDPNDFTGFTTYDIFLNHGCTNIQIHDSHFEWANSGIGGGPNGAPFETIHFYNNTMSNCAWGCSMGFSGTITSPDGPGQWVKGMIVESNDMSGWDLWSQAPGSAGGLYHTDGPMMFGNVTNLEGWIESPIIRANYFHGPFGRMDNTIVVSLGCSTRNALVYDNLLVCTDTNSMFVWINDCANCAGGNHGKCPTNNAIFNNTIVGTPGHKTGLGGALLDWALVLGGHQITVTNNIFHQFNVAYRVDDDSPLSDYNVFGDIGFAQSDSNGQNQTNLTQWIARGYDTHSLTNVNPNFKSSTDFHLTGSSPSVLAGANIASVFTLDKDGVSRPLAGTNWDIGAYQYFVASGNPEMIVTPTSISFGSVIKVGVPTISITVSNAGGGTLNGNATSDSGNFVVTAGSGYGIAGGTAASVTVQFAPAGVAGTYSGNLTLTGGGGAVVPMSGVATNFPTAVLQGKVTTSGKVVIQ